VSSIILITQNSCNSFNSPNLFQLTFQINGAAGEVDHKIEKKLKSCFLVNNAKLIPRCQFFKQFSLFVFFYVVCIIHSLLFSAIFHMETDVLAVVRIAMNSG